MSLDKLTTAELEAELQRRREQERLSGIPRPLPNPDFTKLIRVCEQRIATIASDDGDKYTSDGEHFIYEAAMEAVYGNDVWYWINDNL